MKTSQKLVGIELKNNLIKRFKDSAAFALSTVFLFLISNRVFAEDIEPVNKASTWLSNTFIGIAISVLAPVVMYNLWQLQLGQKEAREIAKPILITAAIVGTPTAIALLVNLIKA